MMSNMTCEDYEQAIISELKYHKVWPSDNYIAEKSKTNRGLFVVYDGDLNLHDDLGLVYEDAPFNPNRYSIEIDLWNYGSVPNDELSVVFELDNGECSVIYGEFGDKKEMLIKLISESFGLLLVDYKNKMI